MTRHGLPLVERFLLYVDKQGPMIEGRPDLGPCWVWTGFTKPMGYGGFQVSSGRSEYAHRVSWELFRGPIPAGLQIDHFACYRHECVNPDHLEPKTQSENAKNVSPGSKPKGPKKGPPCHCGEPVTARGLCKRHYRQWYRKARRNSP